MRRDLAMTGEITLRGRVMPIGGLKEKLLAAHRGGITTVLVPKENRKDLREIPRRVLKTTRIVLVEHVDEVLREALCLSDPDAIFGKRIAPMEYLHGKLDHARPARADRRRSVERRRRPRTDGGRAGRSAITRRRARRVGRCTRPTRARPSAPFPYPAVSPAATSCKANRVG